jgi:hypothetical protein
MKHIKKFETVKINDGYLTEVDDKDIYIYDYNHDLIDGFECESCKIQWYVDIEENSEGIESFEVKIKEIDIRLNVSKFTFLNVDNLETKDEIENIKIKAKRKIQVEFEYDKFISFPFKPKGVELNYREKSVLVEFN